MTTAVFAPPPRFRLLRQLGEGATGLVYEAVDQERGVRVALKTILRSSASGRARLEREFQSLRELQHKNLVGLEELFTQHEPWFFTMELVEGTDFIAYVRPEGGLDLERLRGALRQLARAVAALHDAQKIHRDVKPANIRVRADGRVVLLDFGLVTHAEQERRSTEKLVGTVEYMAPEQASVGDLGPAADWYGVGSILYEALTGRLPFEGAPLEIMMSKQKDEPPPPRRVAPAVPADLDGLCCDLLRFDPAARPTGRQVLQRLHGTSVSLRPPPMSESSSAPFVGRARELQQLRAAFEKTRQGTAVALFLEGESGLGKSALVRRFLEILSTETEIVVLEGLCRERESVSYKAFDGVIEALTRFLIALSPAEASVVLSRQTELLALVFPILKRVDEIASRPVPVRGALDPLEERRRVFAACRELFSRMAQRYALVVVIDDLQWADADSLALLGEIMRPPEAPPLLLVATMRATGSTPTLRVAQGLDADVRHLAVERLPEAEAMELAALLMDRSEKRSAVDAAEIVREAKGHPLFIDELVRHASVGARAGGAGAESLRLEDALWARIERLDATPRLLVELIAVAGMAIGTPTLASAAKIDLAATNKQLARLRVENLVRSTGGRRSDVAEPYHDRVREAVLAHIAPEAKRALHERIAVALKSERSPDPEALFVHWREAGNAERAATHAEEAAAVAEGALAFDHAATLFRQALELRALEGPAAVPLRRRLADALANAGVGADAAREYLLAASAASPAEALALRQRAAEQFLLAGFIDEGLDTCREVLASAGMKLPRTPLQAIVSYLFRRLLIWLRGVDFVERDETQISKRELTVVDLCWALSFALSAVDNVRGADFQARGLLLALKLGEPYRVARALAMEASLGAGLGDPWDETQVKTARAVAIATRVGSSRAIALAVGMAGAAAYCAGRYRLGLEQLDDALAKFRDVSGAWSEVVRARYFVLRTLAHLGDLVELSNRVPLYLREAEERGDRYGRMSCCTGQAILVWLARDNAQGAHATVAHAMRSWSRHGFHIAHWQALIGHADADLYEGDGASAWDRVVGGWAPLERSYLTRIEIVRTYAFYLRGRAALALAATDERRRSDLAREAGRDARRCIAEGSAFSVPLGSLLLGGQASLAGDVAGALAHLGKAVTGFEAGDMALHASVCRYVAAEVGGGGDGETARDQAARWMQAHGIRAPAKFVRMYAPGFVRRA